MNTKKKFFWRRKKAINFSLYFHYLIKKSILIIYIFSFIIFFLFVNNFNKWEQPSDIFCMPGFVKDLPILPISVSFLPINKIRSTKQQLANLCTLQCIRSAYIYTHACIFHDAYVVVCVTNLHLDYLILCAMRPSLFLKVDHKNRKIRHKNTRRKR